MPAKITTVEIPAFQKIQDRLETYLIPLASQLGLSGGVWTVSVMDLGDPCNGHWLACMYPREGMLLQVSGWLDASRPPGVEVAVWKGDGSSYRTEMPDRKDLPAGTAEKFRFILKGK